MDNKETNNQNSIPTNDIANVANESKPEAPVQEEVAPTNEELGGEINKVAEETRTSFKQAPNVALDNAPIVEQPKEEAPAENGDLPQFNETAQTIGKIKPDKQKSPIAMLILFGILIAFILYMPEAVRLISEYMPDQVQKIEELFGIDETMLNGVNSDIYGGEDEPKEEENNTNTLKLLDLTNTLEIKLNDLSITNLNKTVNNGNYYINFNIKNNKTTAYTFSKKLYLDFYNSKDVFINRSLVDITSIDPSSTVESYALISKDVYDNGTKIIAVLRNGDDYPSVTIQDNMLTCKNDTRTIIYGFKDNKLISINDTQTNQKIADLSTYASVLTEKKKEIGEMDAIPGVTAVLTEDETGYVTTISLNYTTAEYSKLTYKEDYYDKDTKPKVISFELVSKGYTCN